MNKNVRIQSEQYRYLVQQTMKQENVTIAPLKELSFSRQRNMSEQPENPVGHPARQPSIDEATLILEKRLKERPDQRELVERNILKDPKVSPALVANKAKLERSQLEDKLEHALQKRPKPEELVKEGILQDNEAPPAEA
ncbi:hypothetical protein C8J56DRAFT_927774 [Mycena floridula]|nr:hypothetical protein C8J56DRAFT_927774 [Mycena floridula]